MKLSLIHQNWKRNEPYEIEYNYRDGPQLNENSVDPPCKHDGNGEIIKMNDKIYLCTLNLVFVIASDPQTKFMDHSFIEYENCTILNVEKEFAIVILSECINTVTKCNPERFNMLELDIFDRIPKRKYNDQLSTDEEFTIRHTKSRMTDGRIHQKNQIYSFNDTIENGRLLSDEQWSTPDLEIDHILSRSKCANSQIEDNWDDFDPNDIIKSRDITKTQEITTTLLSENWDNFEEDTGLKTAHIEQFAHSIASAELKTKQVKHTPEDQWDDFDVNEVLTNIDNSKTEDKSKNFKLKLGKTQSNDDSWADFDNDDLLNTVQQSEIKESNKSKMDHSLPGTNLNFNMPKFENIKENPLPQTKMFDLQGEQPTPPFDWRNLDLDF
eukprot:NODE_13_length_54415_cov_0.522424.p14 type:complete len:382 gc:universal NODE_13_length_54415_cov_0.522424:20838-21983(+)